MKFVQTFQQMPCGVCHERSGVYCSFPELTGAPIVCMRCVYARLTGLPSTWEAGLIAKGYAPAARPQSRVRKDEPDASV